MTKVFVDVGLLDGYLAGANRRPGNPLGDGGIAIHEWLFATATFQQMHLHFRVRARAQQH